MNSKIVILHVVGTRPVGGIGSMLKNVNKVLDLDRFQFIYAFASDELDGNFDREVKAYQSSVAIFPSYKISNLFLYFKKLNSFYKNHAKNIDIVHVHSPNTGVLDLYFAKKYGIPVRILHSHSTKYSGKRINSVRNFFLQMPVKYLSTDYFACGIKAAEFLFGEKSSSKVRIIHNAIFSQNFIFNSVIRIEKRRALQFIDDSFVVGHIGSFTEEKNHVFLLDVFSEIYKRNNKAVLLLIGTGKLEEVIRHKVEELGLQSVVFFLGQCSNIADLLQIMDVYVFPSKFEGLPVTLIEAQAAGLKCFVSENVTVETKISDNVEFLSIAERPSLWADCILSLSVGYERENMSIVVKNAGYDIENEVSKLEELYSVLVKK